MATFYRCDRCKKEITGATKKMTIKSDYGDETDYDFCVACYTVVDNTVKGIN